VSSVTKIAGPSGRVGLCLLKLWDRISQGALISVCCECFLLSDSGLCDKLITRPEESYRLWCVAVCELELQPTGGCRACKKEKGM